jgi:hypothetical protein
MDDYRDHEGRPPPPGELAGPGVEAAARPLLDVATRLFGLAGAALLLPDEGGGLAWMAAAGELVGELHTAAPLLWSGPCRQVLAGAAWVVTDDLPGETRWPELAREPGLRRARRLLCVPVELAGGTPAALAVVRRAAGAFTSRDVDAILDYTEVLAALLRLGAEAESRARVIAQLEHALQHRIVIEQAKGVLMEREGIGGQAAFERLRRAARASRRRVTDLAEEVVAGQPLREPPAGA